MKKKLISLFLLCILLATCGCSLANEAYDDTTSPDASISTPENKDTTTAENPSNTQKPDAEATVPEDTTADTDPNKPVSPVPFEGDAIIEALISKMSAEELVGQMFYVRCPSNGAVEKVSQYHLGGYILFGDDFKGRSRSEIVANIESYQAAADIPLLVGVDEEGGTVVRVSSNPALRSSRFLSPWDTYVKGGWDGIEADAAEKAELLLSLGINVNMAPVCDLTDDPNAFMYYRSFTYDVNDMCTFVNKYVTVTQERQLGTVLKHFPGYGNNVDTHTGIAYDERPYSEFQNRDFKPFTEGIESGVDCILVAHNIVTCMDTEYPASLSENVHRILREELNFEGVIMTDDLSMDAIRRYTGDDTAAVFAAKCGNDILCCTDVDVQYPAVLAAVNSGEISIDRVKDSVRRILRWKYELGLIE